MNLSRHAREYLRLTLTTAPAVTAWDATFDKGTTWVAGVRVGVTDEYRWLVAGSSAVVGTAVAVLAPGLHAVTVRATDSPEIVARDVDSIVVE